MAKDLRQGRNAGGATTDGTGNPPARGEWQDPVITRIDIKRTLAKPGSNTDGFGGTTPQP